MSTHNFALIGCGRIAYKHVEALKILDDAEIIAVCDIKADRAKKYSEKLDVPYYLDYREMLDKEDIEIVNILTPSGTHADIAMDVMNYGKHVVVEKPMALTTRDCEEMIHCADENAIRLFVVKQNRFNIAVQKAREALESGRFGKLFLGTIRVRWSRNQAYYDQDDWRGTWDMDGGVLTNQAIHHIDLLQWFLGPVESVMAMSSTKFVDIEVENTGVAVLKFVNGALGVIEGTTATRPDDLEGSLSILGEKGTVEIGGFAVNEIKVWNFADDLSEDDSIAKDNSENPPNVYGFGHKEYMKDVVKTLNNGKAALVGGFEGSKSIEIINAIYESIETGEKVYINNQFMNSRLGTK